MSEPVEYVVEDDGVAVSRYCTVCSRELGADVDAPTHDGMPPAGCPVHGVGDPAWESWNVEISPLYPHVVIDA